MFTSVVYTTDYTLANITTVCGLGTSKMLHSYCLKQPIKLDWNPEQTNGLKRTVNMTFEQLETFFC